MCCMAKEDKKVLFLVEKIMVSISCMFGMIVVVTRRDSWNIKRWDKEIYSNVCVEMGVANLLGEQCCVKYYL